jgi:nicotinamidase-related amidase
MNTTSFKVGKNKSLSLIVGQPALLVIDMQHDFLDGTFMTVSPSLIPNTRKLLEAARSAKIPVIHTKECHRPGKIDIGVHEIGTPIHCVEGTKGIEIIDELAPISGEHVVLKRRWNAFLGTDLDILLKNLKVDTLIVSGVVADYCVLFTSAEAHQRDYHVRLVEECTNSDSESAKAAIELIRKMTTSVPITLDIILKIIDEYGAYD